MNVQDILNTLGPVIAAVALLCATALSASMVMLTALVNLKPFTERLDGQIAALARYAYDG